MKAAVILFPGINRERDVARALHKASGRQPDIVWHSQPELPDGTDLVVLPGGFSYGDYLRCGAIAARAPVMNAVRRHAARGGLVLAICNGFQIACEAGLLPGVLVRNKDLRFLCHFQHVTVERNDTAFTRRFDAGQAAKFCVAHGEGNYTADPPTLARLEGEGRVAFRYCDSHGSTGGQANPNGSERNIAGVYSEKLNVLGLMPHPENLIDPLVGGTDGLTLFESSGGLIAAEPGGVRVMLDANVLDQGGNASEALLERFLTLAASARLRVTLGSGVRDEMAHPRAPVAVRSAALAFEAGPPRVLTHQEKLDRIRVRAVLRGDTMSDKHDRDAAHVSEAAEAGCDWFITRDKRILRRRDELRRVLPRLRIATLAAFLDAI